MCKENADCGCAKKDPRYPKQVCVNIKVYPEHFREARRARGLTQQEAAQKLGLTLVRVRELEGDTNEPRVGLVGIIKSLFSSRPKTSAATAAA